MKMLFTCICDAGPGCDKNYLQVHAVGRFLSRVSYLPSYDTVPAVPLLRESYKLVLRDSYVFLQLSDRAHVSGARCVTSY